MVVTAEAPMLQLGLLEQNLAARGRVTGFVKVVELMAGTDSRGAALQKAKQQRCPEQVVRALEALQTRAPVAAGTTSGWGAPLSPYDSMAESFLESTRNISAFDAAYPFMKQLPLQVKVPVATAGASAVPVDEASPKATLRAPLTSAQISPVKVPAYVVVSKELLQIGGPAALAYLNSELAREVAHGTNVYFVAQLKSGLSGIPSSGVTWAQLHTDFGALLAAISIGDGAKLF